MRVGEFRGPDSARVRPRPRSLNQAKLGDAFAANLRQTIVSGGGLRLSSGQSLVGVYYLCGHADECLRGWAKGQVAGLDVVEDAAGFAEVEGVLEDFMGVLEAIESGEEVVGLSAISR